MGVTPYLLTTKKSEKSTASSSASIL